MKLNIIFDNDFIAISDMKLLDIYFTSLALIVQI